MRSAGRRIGSLVVVAAGVAAALVGSGAPSPAHNPPARVVAEAPDAVSAGLVARRQGVRVEVAGERTETRTVFANPDGTSTAELTVVPTRVRQGNAWVPVDTTVVRRPDGTVGPAAAVGGAVFSGGGSAAPLAHLVKDGKTLDVWWPKPLPEPKLAGNEATYPEVLPGVDLTMVANETGYEQHLVIKDARSARSPELARIGLRYAAPGLRLSVDKSGMLVADSQDGHVFTAPPPSMWSQGSLRQVRLGVELGDGTLTLTTDRNFLADPTTRYPVVVDPAWNTGGWNTWTSVLEGLPNSTFPRRSGAGPDIAQVGQCYPDPNCDGINTARTYVQFDTNFLWGKDVLSATLDSSIVHSPNCSGSDNRHWLWKANGPINDATTWGNQPNQPSDNRGVLSDAIAPRSNPDWGCPNWQPIGFDAKGAMTPGVTTVMITAQGGFEDDGMWWRKYWAKKDPNGDGFQLRVNYNTRPNAPSELSTDPPLAAPCTWCAGKSYTANNSIRLQARLSDPDPQDMLDPMWRVFKNGASTEPEHWERNFQVNGAVHSKSVDLSDPSWQDKTVSWDVIAGDNVTAGGRVTGTSFVVDRTPPDAPIVSSLLYNDKVWHGGVGVPDTFTFRANKSTDIDHYEYGFQEPPTTVAVATGGLSGPASVTVAPDQDGPQTLHVRSVDRAGNRSDTAHYRMYVRAGNGAYAQYSFEGNAEDSAFLGDRNGTLTGGAAYTPGAVGTALLLDGRIPSGMTAPNVVRTDTSFSVSAWVRPDELPAGVMGVVGQDSAASDPAGGSSGWLLDYRDDGQGPKWAFYLQSGDPARPGWQGPSGRVPQLGKWTHLTGVYDRIANTAQLYVDGVPVAAPYALPAGFVSAQAGGPLVVGRDQWHGGVGNPWRGAIDELQVYDRPLSAAEVGALVSKDNVQVGHWRFEETSGTTVKNSVIGGDSGILMGGAELVAQGAVGRAVHFNGTDGHVITNGPAVRTDQSFSVAAWVWADKLVTTGAMTAVSQDSGANSGFYLQYQSQTKKWTFTKVTTDDNTGVGVQATASQAPITGGWVHLAGVYDAGSKQLRIYVNGESGGNPVAYNGDPWTATGPLVMGRSEFHGQQADYWPGSVDEVRVYSRVLSAEEIKGLVTQNNVTSGSWKLDGSTVDDSGRGLGGTAENGPAFVGGQSSVPTTTDLALQLDAAKSQYVHAKNAVDTSKSFAVSTWVRPDNPNQAAAAVSEDGGFSLTAAANGKWSFRVGPGGVAGAPDDRAEGGSVQYGVWTHVAGVYSKERQVLELYVNGVLLSSARRTADAVADGELQLGRARFQGSYINYFTGAIDDVALYNRPLFAEEIRTMAGRDLTLVHQWALDEGAGTAAMDSIGPRTGTLSNGPTYVAGKLGNAIHFDGVNDSVATAGIDLRTDQNFTVSAWVYLDRASCDGGCRKDAVSIDAGGERTFSKLRLGHIMNDPEAAYGYWIFEMPEPDGTVTDAAVRVAAGEVASWVFLTGVYDAPSQKIWLYVNGTRADDGTINTPWQSSGGLRIGRATENGAATGFWPGSVDDVRLYSMMLDKDRVTGLYRSYPSNAAAPLVPPAPDAGYWKLDEGSGTAAADASGRGRTATLRGGVTWGPWAGGRPGYAVSPNGSTGYLDTDGPVLATEQSFSVTALVSLANTTADRPVLAQDRTQVSAFQLQYRKSEGRYAVVVPSADSPTAASTVLVSSGQIIGNWTHLGVVYDAGLHQLRLYVNGRLSAVQVGVSIMDSSGKFAIGRALRGSGTDFFAGWMDEVRAYSRALSDGELRAIHDAIPEQIHGSWTFEGVPTDTSWRNNPTTLAGGTSYVAGKHGQGLQLDGVSGVASARDSGVNPLDSFEVSAWVKLSRLDQDATVLAQDGIRTSAFILQYNKNVGRWVFGAPTQDADGADFTYAYSPQAPALNTWTHLVGVYDNALQQFKLYVNGELAGTRPNAKPLPAWGSFTIGRHKANGASTGYFAGVIDDVRTDIFLPTDADIRTWATA